MAETLDERADRLLAVGLAVAERIRDEDPMEVRRTVDAQPVDELRDAYLLLAACVPVDLPLSVLLGWWRYPRRELKPCGTATAAKRHRARGEPLDPACDWAIHEYDRVRSRAIRDREGITHV